jgi:hypothetical protein
MAIRRPLIIEVAAAGSVARRLEREPPASVASGAATVVALPSGEHGHLLPPDAGEVVLSVPSPETLPRDPADVTRVVDEAGTGEEPLVIEVEVAEELREDELAPVVAAAQRSSRSVILRVMREP